MQQSTRDRGGLLQDRTTAYSAREVLHVQIQGIPYRTAAGLAAETPSHFTGYFVKENTLSCHKHRTCYLL